jgi:hypothetical protein
MSETYSLLYPEHRTVSAVTILGWHADAVANKECEGGLDTDDVRGAIEQLEDAGLITVEHTS